MKNVRPRSAAAGKAANDGLVHDYSEPGIVKGRLFDFGIGSHKVLLLHAIWLREYVGPILLNGGSISLTGLTSRSGADDYNLKLSERRTKAVFDLLRREVVKMFPYRIGLGFDSGMAGIGESDARNAGQRDGHEDGFYRAVVVHAWSKPTPPTTQQSPAKPEAALVKRVASRKWFDVQTRSSGGEPGNAGSELGQFVGKLYAAKSKGGSDDRTYTMVPRDYVVTMVRDDYVIDETNSAVVATVSYSHRIDYTWGPNQDWVGLHKITKQILNKGVVSENEVKRRVPRYRIWKETTSPDASVIG